MDILLDWDEKQVMILYNGESRITNFYNKLVDSVDKVMLYNLNPDSESFWRNIKVCGVFETDVEG